MVLSLILLPMLSALIGFGICHKNEKAYYYVALATCTLEFILSLACFFMGPQDLLIPMIVDHGLHLEMDGFRKVYSLVISFMWMMTMALSRDYFKGHHHLSRYFFFNLMTLSATMGVFNAANLYTAFVFFEIMSFTSFPWVIQEETEGAIRAANTYLAVAVIGGLTALMGIFLMQHQLGTTEIALLYDRAVTLGEKKTLYIAAGCILFGFGAKAGMFPLHIWLPKAHPVAPAPASSLLSGVLTKSGIWGVLVLSCDLLRFDHAWGYTILLLGTITMFMGALLALFSIDLKRTLACSSMSQIGFILVGVGMMCLLGEENALAGRGTLLHMMNHSVFKLVLFMCAGVVYMNLHVLDLNEIRGFGKKKPILLVCFLLGAVGIGGIPGFSGYISKTLLHEAIVEGEPHFGMLLNVVEWIFLISGGLTLAYMTKLFVCLFVDEPSETVKKAHSHFGEGRYMNPLSTIALVGSAILIPILGMSAHWSMDHIAEIGTDFFHIGEMEHAVHYFSLENLKGAVISLAIGAAVYFGIVRTWMIQKGVYLDRWNKKLDLEDLVYRPLLLKILPAIFGWISAIFGENKITGPLYKAVVRVSGILSRAFCDLLDAIVLLLRKTIYKESPLPDPDKARTSWTYRLGHQLDVIRGRHRHEKPGHRYAHAFYKAEHTFVHTTHNLTDTLSFALLIMCVAIVAVLIYVVVIY